MRLIEMPFVNYLCYVPAGPSRCMRTSQRLSGPRARRAACEMMRLPAADGSRWRSESVAAGIHLEIIKHGPAALLNSLFSPAYHHRRLIYFATQPFLPIAPVNFIRGSRAALCH